MRLGTHPGMARRMRDEVYRIVVDCGKPFADGIAGIPPIGASGAEFGKTLIGACGAPYSGETMCESGSSMDFCGVKSICCDG